MTLKQLEVFLAVADTRSFSKGGEMVRLAQSTASQHIRALEDELGVRLFDRASTHVRLTEVGRLFYEHAARICRHCSDAIAAVRRFQGLEQATLRLGASTIPAACLIPDLLGQFAATWPGVTLELQQGDSLEVIRLLQDDLVELAIVGVRPDEDTVRFEELLTERIVLVGSSRLGSDTAVTLTDLQTLPLIQREPGSGTRQAVDTALHKAGIDPRTLRVIAHLGSSEAVRRAVLSGAGYAFLSTLAIGRELAEGVLSEVKVQEFNVERSFYLIWRRGTEFSPAAEAFVSQIKTACRQEDFAAE